MRKIMLAMLVLCLAFGTTACKKSSEDTSEAAEQSETSESLQAEETLELEIGSDAEGVIAPE